MRQAFVEQPLIEELLREMLMVDGQPQPPPKAALDRFVTQAQKTKHGAELFSLVKAVAAVAAGFEATRHPRIAQTLMSCLPPLLDALARAADAELTAEKIHKKTTQPKSTAATRALAPATAKGASIRGKGH